MYKPSENNQLAKLKSHSNRSHNQGSQLIALVEMLAREAAEIDSTSRQAQENHHNIEGEEL